MLRSDISRFILLSKAHELVISVYEATKNFPAGEAFGITSQIRRAAVSVPCNISEGKARGSTGDYRRFLFIARGSLEEVQYLLILSNDLHYIDDQTYNTINGIAVETGKIMNGVLASIKDK